MASTLAIHSANHESIIQTNSSQQASAFEIYDAVFKKNSNISVADFTKFLEHYREIRLRLYDELTEYFTHSAKTMNEVEQMLDSFLEWMFKHSHLDRTTKESIENILNLVRSHLTFRVDLDQKIYKVYKGQQEISNQSSVIFDEMVKVNEQMCDLSESTRRLKLEQNNVAKKLIPLELQMQQTHDTSIRFKLVFICITLLLLTLVITIFVFVKFSR